MASTSSPAAYASLLQRLTSDREIQEDNYLLGGEVEQFERHWAELLGKETAIFMPSGTLANQLALRALAGSKRRVIVPEISHIYNDTGDACQTLSNLTLIPLGPGAATFTRGDVEAVLARTASGRVAAEVGAIAIESPVRRLQGQMFDWAEAQRITAFARERGIGTHLDGARLFLASAYTGIAPREYAAAFDTVYVSLWKYFNCGQGAILAGPRARARRHVPRPKHVRRQPGDRVAGRAGRAALHGRIPRSPQSRRSRVGRCHGCAVAPPAGDHRPHPGRHQPVPLDVQGRGQSDRRAATCVRRHPVPRGLDRA